MKTTGVTRRVDPLGRITIPKELRRVLGIEVNDPLEVCTEDDTIILKKYEPACLFCGEAKGVINYKGKKICKSCLEEIKGR